MPSSTARWIDELRASGSRFATRIQPAEQALTDDAVSLDSMCDPRWLRAASGRVAEAMRVPRPVVADALLLYGIVVPRVAPVVAALATSGRALRLDTARSSAALAANGSVERFWLVARTTRPSAADAENDDSHRDAYLDVAAHLHDSMSPVVGATTTALRIGRRQVWRLVGDVVVRTLHDVTSERTATQREALRLLGACGAPIEFAPRWERVSTTKGVLDHPRSRSCCLGYQIDDMAYCAGCPRESEPERTWRLAVHLAR